MEYRLLGGTGVKVSALCFGTMTFGGDADEAASAALFARCRDAGINFFDSADTYTHGRSEEILGRLMADCRDELIVATKFANPIREGDPNAGGGSRRHIREAVEASLRRLRTDRIDLYYMHFPDPDTPVEETLHALDDLVRQGKVLYLGASNVAAWEVATALGVSAREGLARFQCLQPMYSLLKRQAEVELLPLARHAGLGVCPYNAMAGGMLSGKYAETRLRPGPAPREPALPGAIRTGLDARRGRAVRHLCERPWPPPRQSGGRVGASPSGGDRPAGRRAHREAAGRLPSSDRDPADARAVGRDRGAGASPWSGHRPHGGPGGIRLRPEPGRSGGPAGRALPIVTAVAAPEADRHPRP